MVENCFKDIPVSIWINFKYIESMDQKPGKFSVMTIASIIGNICFSVPPLKTCPSPR